MSSYITQARFAMSLNDFLKSKYAVDLKKGGKLPRGFREAFAKSVKRNYNKLFHREVTEAIALINRSLIFTE